jgi:hypothetical protein
MIPALLATIEGGFEWIGLNVEYIDQDRLHVSEGLIGQHEHPITVTDDEADGGWYYKGTELAIHPTDCRIDVVVYKDAVWLMVRSDDPKETYDENDITILFTLAWRDSPTDEWFVATQSYGG